MTSSLVGGICCVSGAWSVRNVVYSVVEGDGDETAAPHLIRRIFHEYLERFDLKVGKALNANGRDNLLKPDGIERFLKYTKIKTDCAGVLVLIDTERESLSCPPDLADDLAGRARRLNLPFPVAVVCATCEYESWFLINLDSIALKYALSAAVYEGDPERECSSKEWLSVHMPDGRRYKETQDQESMTFDIDILKTVEQSRSFRRLVHAVEELAAAVETGKPVVTPNFGERES